MRLRAGFSILLLGAAGCYEHAPRRGPIAAATDSLVSAHGIFICRPIPKLLASKVDGHLCGIGTDSNNLVGVFTVDRHGQVLELMRTWRGDSAGEQRLAALQVTLTRRFGPPFMHGLQEGQLVTQWRTDSVCAIIARRSSAPNPVSIEYGLSLRETFGSC